MDPVEAACRDHWGRLLAILVARCRDLDLAEDALADAVEAAVRTWPAQGTPQEPAAWLFTVARRRLVDLQRRRATEGRKLPLLALEESLAQRCRERPAEDEALDGDLPDERLALVLLCCHPALAPEHQAALALRLGLGVSTAEVARLFLVQETTMAARITRAKRRILTSAIPLALPDAGGLPERLEAAARAVHLAFSAGYAPGEGEDLLRVELAGEAVRLARILHEAAPADPTARALLALLLLHHARRDARVDAAGDLVLLGDQDRSLWHGDEIAAGLGLLQGPPPGSPFGAELVLQAQIAALHATAPAPGATDWPAIAERYRRLELLTGSPVVRLNRAVAVAEAEGPRAGLALLEDLDEHLPRNHRLPAVRAELLARSGRVRQALAALDNAVSLCHNHAELRHLERRRAALAPEDRDVVQGAPPTASATLDPHAT
ncbi:RNA polymerase sigma factor [Kytococcus sedentarius]|uniref:RNA polymerase sigma factor n=1 Tax=Kytococcus sedentarius TaxID=1276 RepID=UPI0035BBECFF